MKKYQLGVIGTGFMAKAILQGILQNGLLQAAEIVIYDLNTAQTVELQKQGVQVANSAKEVANSANYLLLAVKPQHFAAVAAEIAACDCNKILSILAGLPIAKIKAAFAKPVKVARAMPNLPVAVSAGMTAIDLSDFDHSEQEFILQIFASIGKVLKVEEYKINAVTGISGSGPAYVFLFIKSLVEAGIQQGLTEQESKLLAVQTVLGGALMVEKDFDTDLQKLIDAVCSKGGTTIEAIDSFQRDNFTEIVEKAVTACVRRAKELSESLE